MARPPFWFAAERGRDGVQRFGRLRGEAKPPFGPRISLAHMAAKLMPDFHPEIGRTDTDPIAGEDLEKIL